MGGQSSHRQAGIPRELADAVDGLLRANPWLGHRSLSGFATEAVRRMLVQAYRDVERRRWLETADLERREGASGPLAAPAQPEPDASVPEPATARPRFSGTTGPSRRGR